MNPRNVLLLKQRYVVVLLLSSIKFLADTYLKYIGWMLFDKVGEVRVACLNVLEPLYSDPDTAPHLELFTEKFKVSQMLVCSCVSGWLCVVDF